MQRGESGEYNKGVLRDSKAQTKATVGPAGWPSVPREKPPELEPNKKRAFCRSDGKALCLPKPLSQKRSTLMPEVPRACWPLGCRLPAQTGQLG